ncbi:13576_t:CDS:2 [Entrophospora sp. SA101]|nr:9345_t:CDS:2 [Entrophospora sp. SA101]CAJ0642459.1 13576_t:CDS:2 [Entrophospora sp. SA101]CAJ0910586.1 5514_t:CDS:2 [Entrophospora sp. SA101]
MIQTSNDDKYKEREPLRIIEPRADAIGKSVLQDNCTLGGGDKLTLKVLDGSEELKYFTNKQGYFLNKREKVI